MHKSLLGIILVLDHQPRHINTKGLIKNPLMAMVLA